MRWFFTPSIMIALVMVFLNSSSLSSSPITTNPLDTPGPHEEKINKLLKEELRKRIPRDRKFYVRELPTIEPWLRLSDNLTLHVEVPSIKTEDPDEALKISLPYFQAYVDAMNNVREARPYFIDFPLTFHMMGFVIGFAEDETTHFPLYDPYIASVLLFGHTLEIKRFYPKITYPNGRTCTDGYGDVYDKSKGLPEAIKQAEIPRFDPEKPKSPIPIPPVVEYRYLNNSGKTEYDYLQAFGKKNGLIFLAFEHLFPPPVDWDVFAGAAYAAQGKNLSLEEAKALALKVQKGLAEFYIQDGRFARCVNESRKEGKPSFENPVNIQRFMGFRVSFWDQYIDRVAPPAIAEFRVYGTKARYYTADEHQRLQLVCEEDFAPFEVNFPLEVQNEKDVKQ